MSEGVGGGPKVFQTIFGSLDSPKELSTAHRAAGDIWTLWAVVTFPIIPGPDRTFKGYMRSPGCA